MTMPNVINCYRHIYVLLSLSKFRGFYRTRRSHIIFAVSAIVLFQFYSHQLDRIFVLLLLYDKNVFRLSFVLYVSFYW